MERNKGNKDIDWKAIQEVTGLEDEVLEEIKSNFFGSGSPQTPEEVRKGILAEREARMASAERPGGVVEQLKRTQTTNPS